MCYSYFDKFCGGIYFNGRRKKLNEINGREMDRDIVPMNIHITRTWHESEKQRQRLVGGGSENQVQEPC